MEYVKKVCEVVVGGRRLGRELGFPTANILVGNMGDTPYGVYRVAVHYNGRQYDGVANYGIKPTLSDCLPTLEVHIFDFEEEIYGETISVDLLEFMRPEQKFESIDQLRSQIERDVQQAKNR